MNSYKVMGVMSGTSLDGIDVAYIHFEKKEQWSFVIKSAETIPYSKELQQKLREAIAYSQEDLAAFDKIYTNYLAETIQSFIKNKEITEIDAVCSHGHTILHQPANGITYQIGNQQLLADLLRQKVVCDFRVQDVALGGQGAPLVPIGDELLFSEYDYCLNLGGFANVSFAKNGRRIAYDICPVNIVLNRYANELGFEYDDRGNLAQSGTLIESLLKELNALAYYQQSPPKSLGLEWVQQEIFPKIDTNIYDVKDILRTCTEHFAQQISKSFSKDAKVLVTGGGAYNDYLLSKIKDHNDVNLIKPTDLLVNYKEALIFGFLGVLRLRNEINCLKSVTGATKNHSSGVIYNPSI